MVVCVCVLGFTPSTFVSSRSQRDRGRQQRPEDFMDEEVFGKRMLTFHDTALFQVVARVLNIEE